jgi:hypothetical protein
MGLFRRAWELVERIEYQNIRIDAGGALLLNTIFRGNRQGVVESAKALDRLVSSVWAVGESVRGWLALMACGLWLGDDDLSRRSAGGLDRALGADEQLEHTAYQSFFVARPPDDRDPWRPSWGDVTREGRLQIESAFAILVSQGYAQQGLDLFGRTPRVFDGRAALQAMGAAALEKQDPATYRQVLRLDAARLELKAVPLSWEQAYGAANTRATPRLPENCDAARARRWLETAFLAARFEGRYEIWRSITDLSPLLAPFPPRTAYNLRERLLAIENLHREPLVEDASS